MKQTGPSARVKGGGRTARKRILRVFGAAACLMIAGCGSSGWTHPSRDPGQMAADERLCNREAQDMALARAGSDRSTYGHPSVSAGGFTPGESPMQMKERSETEQRFTRLFARCMEAKGYSHESES